MFDPLALVTTTLAVPADPDGAVSVMDVAETTVTFVAAAPPMVTPVVPVKFVPVRVNVAPPLRLPKFGVAAVTVGAGINGVFGGCYGNVKDSHHGSRDRDKPLLGEVLRLRGVVEEPLAHDEMTVALMEPQLVSDRHHWTARFEPDRISDGEDSGRFRCGGCGGVGAHSRILLRSHHPENAEHHKPHREDGQEDAGGGFEMDHLPDVVSTFTEAGGRTMVSAARMSAASCDVIAPRCSAMDTARLTREPRRAFCSVVLQEARQRAARMTAVYFMVLDGEFVDDLLNC